MMAARSKRIAQPYSRFNKRYEQRAQRRVKTYFKDYKGAGGNLAELEPFFGALRKANLGKRKTFYGKRRARRVF